jgi:hypothetical protein
MADAAPRGREAPHLTDVLNAPSLFTERPSARRGVVASVHQEDLMSTLPSSRKDGFGTEGIGDNGDSDIGSTGHSSQGGTAKNISGSSRETPPSRKSHRRSEANNQGMHGGELWQNASLKK